jgi:ketosteroid isomerase-like protein
MRNTWTLAVALCAIAAPVLAANKDEESLKKSIMEMEQMMTKHDAKGLATMWTSDGTLLTPSGTMCKGPTEVEKCVGDDMKSVMKDCDTKMTLTHSHMVKDMAMVDIDHELSCKGATPKTMKMHIAGWLEKKKDKWMWMDARPFMPMPAHAGATAEAP